jgi:hypothetical protein
LLYRFFAGAAGCAEDYYFFHTRLIFVCRQIQFHPPQIEFLFKQRTIIIRHKKVPRRGQSAPLQRLNR